MAQIADLDAQREEAVAYLTRVRAAMQLLETVTLKREAEMVEGTMTLPGVLIYRQEEDKPSQQPLLKLREAILKAAIELNKKHGDFTKTEVETAIAAYPSTWLAFSLKGSRTNIPRYLQFLTKEGVLRVKKEGRGPASNRYVLGNIRDYFL